MNKDLRHVGTSEQKRFAKNDLVSNIIKRVQSGQRGGTDSFRNARPSHQPVIHQSVNQSSLNPYEKISSMNNESYKKTTKKQTMMALPIEQEEDPKLSGRRDKVPNYGQLISTDIPFVSLDPSD